MKIRKEQAPAPPPTYRLEMSRHELDLILHFIKCGIDTEYYRRGAYRDYPSANTVEIEQLLTNIQAGL